jgi:hypothetical protein
MSAELDKLLRSNLALWRGRDVGDSTCGIKIGFAAIDTALPDGGWPVGVLTEILSEGSGIGELF